MVGITGQRPVRPDGTVSLGFYGDVHVRGLTLAQAKTKLVLHLRRFLNDDVLGLVDRDDEAEKGFRIIPPGESGRVFVDVAACNSKFYHVQGAVNAPGRLPFTGNETVLDALSFCGWKPDADTAKMVLHRPQGDRKPAREYRIDLEAIYRGQLDANLQLFPGDRLVIGFPVAN